MNAIQIGTCTWNYPSWVGLVYTKSQPRAADFLTEYAQHYRTVEIDSWFYHIPDRADVMDYLSRVDDEFSFTCKLTENITLTHARTHGKADKTLVPNPDFLSASRFIEYLAAIEPMLPRVGAIELEFEYLNRDKMPSVDQFLDRLGGFMSSIPSGIPLAIETRNKNYLTKGYFEFLKKHDLAHVFSEKLGMPHIYDVYEEFGELLGETVIIRLLGGDRKAIEEKTKGIWNKIVEPKDDLQKIVDMSVKMQHDGKRLIISVNNHYEGSAPLTINTLRKLLG